MDEGVGDAAAPPPLTLERHLKTEGWSTNIAAVQIGYNCFFLIVHPCPAEYLRLFCSSVLNIWRGFHRICRHF